MQHERPGPHAQDVVERVAKRTLADPGNAAEVPDRNRIRETGPEEGFGRLHDVATTGGCRGVRLHSDKHSQSKMRAERFSDARRLGWAAFSRADHHQL